MLRTADIEVHIPPVLIGLAAHERLVVMGIHIAQIIGAAAGEARHSALLDGTALIFPALRAAQRGLSALGGKEFVHLGKLERQCGLGHRGGYTVVVINRERFAPVALAREDGIAQAVVDLPASQAVLLNVVDSGGNGLLDAHSGKETRVAHNSLLGVETLLGDVAALDQGDYRQIELLSERIVAAVVRRHSHNGSGAVAGQHIFRNPNGNLPAREGIEGVGAGKDAGHLAGLCDALTLGLLLGLQQIGLNGLLLLRRCELLHPLALGSQNHEGNSEDSVGAGGEDSHIVLLRAVGHLEDHLGALALADPVALHLLEGVGPVDGIETFEQPLGISRDAKLPLKHLLLLHGEASADRIAVLDLIVGQHRAEFGAPVYSSLTLVRDAVLHQQVGLLLLRKAVPTSLSLELLNQGLYRLSLLLLGIVPAVEHLEERPLGPLVVLGIAGADLARPVVGEADAVHLLAVACDVLLGGHGRMLSGLDGILLGGKAEGVVPHRVQHVETLQALVAAVNITCNVSQRMSHVKPRSRGIGEHIQYIILGL